MISVDHIKIRPSTDVDWLNEDQFRYWRFRRKILRATMRLLSTHDFISDSENGLSRVRSEIWASENDLAAFQDDPCIRVIESVIKHHESLLGIDHRMQIDHFPL